MKVNAVRQMIERMSQEIEGLRKILGAHEEKLADAGIIVESNADLLDRQFWAAVPEKGKRARAHLARRMVHSGAQRQAVRGRTSSRAVTKNWRSPSCKIMPPACKARRRRRAAGRRVGLADLADVYASLGGRPLASAIQVAGGAVEPRAR